MAQGDQPLRLAWPRSDAQGAGFFEQAVCTKPDHALAWGGPALARRRVAEFAPPDRREAALAAVGEATSRPLALDPHQPEAPSARVSIRPFFGTWAPLEEALQELLKVAPTQQPTLDALFCPLASAGVLADHCPLRQKTMEADPFDAGYNFRSIDSQWMNADPAAADCACERGLALWPRHAATLLARIGWFVSTARPQRGAPGVGRQRENGRTAAGRDLDAVVAGAGRYCVLRWPWPWT